MSKEYFSFLSSDDKTWIHGVRWIPQNKTVAVLQIVHGMGEYAERYEELAEYLSERGILVVGHDHLGHGKTAKSEEDYGYFSEKNPSDTLITDIHRLRMMIQQEQEGLPYFMLGHSMGSYLLRKYLSIYAEGLQGALILGTGFISRSKTKLAVAIVKSTAKMRGWRYRSKWITDLTFGGPYRKFDLTGEDLSNSWLSKDAALLKKYQDDPNFIFTLNGYLGLFETVAYSCDPENAKKIPKDLPMVLLSGDDDPVGDLGDGVKKVYGLYKKAGIKDLRCKLYENDRHELVHETDRNIVFHDIYVWIKKHI